MEKITGDLKKACSREPKKQFDVVIVLKEESDPKQLPIKSYNRLMDNILSASMKGSEILELEKHDSIQSVEPDGEVGIL
ncbi:MAG: hypothetical protein GVY02_04550 [Bacteroidetes bacterium]|jgi:hypothetical protein|nr:hypothetical protein [Bacteroidota bacterium]